MGKFGRIKAPIQEGEATFRELPVGTVFTFKENSHASWPVMKVEDLRVVILCGPNAGSIVVPGISCPVVPFFGDLEVH